MAQLRALENPEDPLAGGFVVTFPSGTIKLVEWRQSAPIAPVLDAAKEFVKQLIGKMLDETGDRRVALDDIERTNIPSLVAATQQIVMEWNEKRRAALYSPNANPAMRIMSNAKTRH